MWSWIGGVALVSIAAVLLYGVAQQAARRAADDVPRALVARSAAALASGQPAEAVAAGWTVDLTSGETPFVVVYDADHHPLAANATMAGSPLDVPKAVLDDALQRGEDAVTWQPRRTVREATVAGTWTSSTAHGVVVAGVSLAPTQARTSALLRWVAAIWAVCVLLLTAAVLAVVRRSAETGTARPVGH